MLRFKRINKKICHPNISARENTGMTDTGLQKVLKDDNVINFVSCGLSKIDLVKVNLILLIYLIKHSKSECPLSCVIKKL